MRNRILKVRSVILKPIFCQFCFNLYPKLRIIIIDDWSVNLCFENGYSLELRGFYTLSSQTSLNALKNLSQIKRRGKHHWRRGWRRRTQEPDEKSKMFLMYSFFYSFFMLSYCLNINLYVIFDMIYG
jgi:hypothetical protein